MTRPTVCVADDHELFREGLVSLLARDGRLDVTCQARDGGEAVAMARQARPGALLLDVDMPGQHVSATIAAVKREAPETRIIILTMHDDDVLRTSLLQAGAHAYVDKTVAVGELVAVTLSAIARRPTGAEVPQRLDGHITQREAEVLRLVACARSNREIAQELNIAEGTVKRHLSNVFEKLGASSRLDAVMKAQRLGAVPVG